MESESSMGGSPCSPPRNFIAKGLYDLSFIFYNTLILLDSFSCVGLRNFHSAFKNNSFYSVCCVNGVVLSSYLVLLFILNSCTCVVTERSKQYFSFLLYSRLDECSS